MACMACSRIKMVCGSTGSTREVKVLKVLWHLHLGKGRRVDTLEQQGYVDRDATTRPQVRRVALSGTRSRNKISLSHAGHVAACNPTC